MHNILGVKFEILQFNLMSCQMQSKSFEIIMKPQL